jgi:transcriptional regulator with XRE-family HTH domain
MALADQLRKRMDEKGWTLADLARESDVAKGYLWEILDGRGKKPSAETLYKVAAALQTSVADLLEKPPPPAAEDAVIPPELERLAKELDLPETDVKMLASIRFRGDQPTTEDGWRYLYESIRRSVRD